MSGVVVLLVLVVAIATLKIWRSRRRRGWERTLTTLGSRDDRTAMFARTFANRDRGRF